MSRFFKQILDRVQPTQVILPDTESEVTVWPLGSEGVKNFARAVLNNDKAMGELQANPDALKSVTAIARFLIMSAADAVERAVLTAVAGLEAELTDDEIETELKALRRIPFGDFNALVAATIATAVKGGVPAFLAVWDSVGVPSGMSDRLASAMRAATTETEDRSNSSPDPMTGLKVGDEFERPSRPGGQSVHSVTG